MFGEKAKLQYQGIANRRTCLACGGTENGFSLIEVLIAVAVLAIGLLGLAALQTVSFRFNHESYQRTQATIQAETIIDRIRANPTGNYVIAATGTPPAVTTDCNTSTCTAAEMVTFDHNQWITQISQNLLQGNGDITAAGTDRVIVTIGWTERNQPREHQIEVEL